ncbi:UDP-2,3-diacylglucosamine hydrolase [Jannaschia pagri]|uniref:UDP-2,3-diacylglucosamine hydrolase n=1 Tax=Jannaschia pagri TaxID=2829797 RepID=A0ABQ4NJV7_9RHOB|nr:MULTISPECIES: UDP-2,3-diacylglucosamine diphosphatase [unclassified Jannaschia]GIT90804.1 UDP-2,3-diacylglucosamine hydrolase [Jannaschia sp. AI_61]GIT94636.1 UDP-2,3-diacylglucosamine hydrolase [Jannaschia sp. AI_62]
MAVTDRTIFLSDIHLGTRGCQAALLADFLERHECDTLYLVGDIFDGWRLRRGWHWPPDHNKVVELLLEKSRKGTRVVFIPGNHDEVMRGYFGMHFGGIEVVPHADFISAKGERFLVTHGDEFDAVVANAKWLAHLGDRAYAMLIWLNPRINAVRRLWSPRYWSLSKWAKHQVKHAVNFISKYEDVLSEDARQRGYDGVICGHIHHAALRTIGDIRYVNTGDWVESCTAIVESQDGDLRLVDWEARRNRHRLVQRRARRANAPRRQTPQTEQI